MRHLTAVLCALAVLTTHGRAGAQCPPASTSFGAAPNSAACGTVLTWTFTGTPFAFTVHRSTTGQFADAQTLTLVGGNLRTYTDGTAVAGIPYTYWVRAQILPTTGCDSGLGTLSRPTTITLPGPPAPTGVSASTGGCDTIALSWASSLAATSWRVVLTTPSGAVVDDRVVTSTSYQWQPSAQPAVLPTAARVTSIGPCGPGGSAAIAISVPSSPRPPSAVTATSNRACEVLIAWTPNPVQTGGYRIERRNLADTFGFGTSLYSPAGATSYADTDAVPGATYQYTVFAQSDCGQEAAATDRPLGSALAGSGLAAVPPTRVLRHASVTLALPGAPSAAGVTFRWRKGVGPDGSGGVVMVNSARIAGASTPTLTIADAAFDDADLYALDAGLGCGPQTRVTAVVVRNPCPADFDGVAGVDLLDIFGFLEAWFAGCP